MVACLSVKTDVAELRAIEWINKKFKVKNGAAQPFLLLVLLQQNLFFFFSGTCLNMSMKGNVVLRMSAVSWKGKLFEYGTDLL